jgi:multiple sugar transport system permease protein
MKRLTRAELFWGFAFITPALVLLLIFRFIPILASVVVSFADYSVTRGFQSFIGFLNYQFLFSDKDVQNSLITTLIFVLILTSLQLALALFCAILLKRSSRISIVFRLIFFSPYVISLSIASIIWWLIYADMGLANGILGVLGIRRQPFLTSEKWALWALIIMLLWKGFGYWMVVYIAGLNNIPETLYEAAQLDGAGLLKQFMYVTWPLLKRVTLFTVVSDTTINFLIFAPVYIMTMGGPRGRTMLLAYYAYRTAFVYGDLGYASAVSVLLFLIIGLITALEFRLLRSQYEY